MDARGVLCSNTGMNISEVPVTDTIAPRALDAAGDVMRNLDREWNRLQGNGITR